MDIVFFLEQKVCIAYFMYMYYTNCPDDAF